MTPQEADALARELQELLDRIPEESELSTSVGKRLRSELTKAAQSLAAKVQNIDPVHLPDCYFNPADPRLFGIFSALALMGQDRQPLAEIDGTAFYGAGVYALYYTGPFAPYAAVSGTEHPLYVGKADPQDRDATDAPSQGARLWRRLRDHRKSLAATELGLEHFECRYLVVHSGWEVQAENALIALVRPLWNKETKILLGFGKHGDSATTRVNKR